MNAEDLQPVLLLGGSGHTGSQATRALRKLHPGLRITIAARDMSRAKALAAEIGRAEALTVDLRRPDLGLPASSQYSIVAVILKDLSLNSLRYAQAKRIPYLCVSDGAVELAPTIALYTASAQSAPVMMLGHWMGGTTTMATLAFCAEFRSVEAIEVGIIYDSAGASGPVAREDFERARVVTSAGLTLKDGVWHWDTAQRKFAGFDGAELEGEGVALLDVPSLAVATGAKSVRVDFAHAASQGTLRGETPSHEIVVEISGQRKDGAEGRFRYEISALDGFSTMSGRGMALSIERLLGLVGGPVKPGLYNPENLLDPAYVVKRMKEFGAQLRRV